MNINTVKGLVIPLLGSALINNLVLAGDGKPSPLDVDRQPTSPTYESLFPDAIVPLDTRLSWKQRFLGNETFNADQRLPETSPVIESLSKQSVDGDRQASFDTYGVIKQVKPSENKIKVEHGPIERLGMPAMTMMFRVEDPAQLTGLEKGTEIDFDVDNTSAGFTITRLAMKAANFDASGVVKQVRASESKIKIQHGPIDKLGMPGMTMLFKVRDPQQLTGLERDMPIEFDVVNEGSGFEITRLRAANDATLMTGKGSTCYRVGPFATRNQALATEKRYDKTRWSTRIVSDSERQYMGSLVYVDGHATRDQALASAKTLEANGILDYAILDDGGKRNVLSLGVFGNQQNANRLKARVEAMNLPVKTEAFYRARSLYWLQLELPADAGLPQALNPDELESGITQIPHDCNL